MSNINFQCKTFEELKNEELYKILRLRAEVFILEQDCVYQDLDNSDQEALHIFTKQEGQLLAYARILQPGVKYSEASIGRIITRTSMRGLGIGQLLVKESIAQCCDRWPKSSISISAQLRLETFYSKLGFQTVSSPYLEDDIPHIKMSLQSASIN